MYRPKKIGFIVNPIAGMGGRVGLKGTDNVVDKAIELGAKPIAPQRALDALIKIKNLNHDKIKWYTVEGLMGESILRQSSFRDFDIVYTPKNPDKTSARDTKMACEKMLETGVDLILFCGGDGTARDIYEVVDKKTPMLGIPAGVKMHSGVFAINPDAAAKILKRYLDNELRIGEVELLDLDEEKYRNGVWEIKLYGTGLGLIEPTYIQSGKAVFHEVTDEEIKDEIAEYIIEEMKKDTDSLYILGSGSTLYHIGKKIGVDKTLLGIDAVYSMRQVGKDLNEKQLLELLNEYEKAKLVISPIGAQGFILGRGNQQLSPKVIKKIGIENIIVVATPSKLASTPILRVDTGDKKLDELFVKRGYMIVVIGYRLMKVVKFQREAT
ncbi:MAG: ATP-NAD kinase family protein [Thermoplasmata archaeon]|nr:ATP-NAD kinase family protein [Thermoplasmata archaeon]